MQQVISEFHQLAPNIKLKMRALSCYITKQALIKGSADLGICYDESESDDRLSTINPFGGFISATVCCPKGT